MTAVRVPIDDLPGRPTPPPLHAHDVEGLDDAEVEQLLLNRFRAFTRRGLSWKHALLLAVTPDDAR